ncbi:hypothetical protein BDQ17DRAFT_834776 [Cyathus striatus]|nr:hypothetical protein BDQ17DRAFT_834776 [Cyathus striatus]
MKQLVPVRVASAVCTSVAICSTIYRLYARRKRLRYDDGFALFSMLVLCVQMSAIFVKPTIMTGVTRSYILDITFYVVLWSARLSILCSIIRIQPSSRRRRIMASLVPLFLAACLVLIGQLFWICESQEEWKRQEVPQCALTRQVAVFQLVSDIVADLILLLSPLQLFLLLQDLWLRYRLALIFSTCIMTTIVSLVHAAYILNREGSKIIIVGVVEDSVSLIICNFPIIAAAFLRLSDKMASNRHNMNDPTSIRFARAFTMAPIGDEEQRTMGEAYIVIPNEPAFPEKALTRDTKSDLWTQSL